MKKPGKRKSIVAFDKSVKGQLFILLLERKNAFSIVTQTYFNSDHTINFCVVKVFMVLLETKKEFLKLTKRPWVRNDYIPNEQRCILLLETNNTLRIFMVLSETKSALVIKISQRYCLFTIWHSDLFSICFIRRLDFFVSGDITKILGNITQVLGDMTSGEMTLGRLDRLPLMIAFYHLIRFNILMTAFRSISYTYPYQLWDD